MLEVIVFVLSMVVYDGFTQGPYTYTSSTVEYEATDFSVKDE